MHVTARLAQLPLAAGATYRALRRALRGSLARADFRVLHLAVRPRRIELVVEADDRLALARGMQGFQVSVAKTLNRLARRRGCVFLDRYRPHVLATRAAVRAVLGAVTFARTDAWPETHVLALEAARAPRRWMRTRADEDS